MLRVITMNVMMPSVISVTSSTRASNNLYFYLNGVCVGPPDERKDVEGNEEAVEQVIRQHLVQVVNLQAQDVVLADIFLTFLSSSLMQKISWSVCTWSNICG